MVFDTDRGYEEMNIDQLKQVIEMLDASSVNELSLETEAYTLKLKKQGETFVAAPQQHVPAPVHVPPQSPAPAASAEAETDDTVTINALMVGTFYSRPNPDKPSFVTVGDRVEVGQVVCILEAMKLFNNLNAEVAGTVVEVLVEDGDLVEFGQPLFRVRP